MLIIIAWGGGRREREGDKERRERQKKESCCNALDGGIVGNISGPKLSSSAGLTVRGLRMARHQQYVQDDYIL